MCCKWKNRGLIRSSNIQGPRLWGSKSGKEIVHNHQAALSKITIFIRKASGRFAAQKVQQCPKESEEVTVTTLVPYPSGVRECDQGIEKLCSSTVSPSGLVDCDISVKDSENEDSDAVPMYVKHTEAMLDEIDRMKEVEESEEPTMLDEIDRMKEVEESEDPFMEFDSSFMKDPLSVVEYVDDNYALCRKTENQSCVSPSDMAQQQDINEKMRAILIDWFIEVYDKFEVMDETLFLTINLIDRLLERQVVVRKKLQLVGVTAMLLACKYEVVSVPLMEDFVLISDKAYTRQDVLDMEKSLVNKLQFNFSVPTPYVFIRRFLKAAQSDKKIEVLSFLIALCLVEYEMLKYPLSLLAAAAIYTAQCSLSRFKQWHTNYLEDELQ